MMSASDDKMKNDSFGLIRDLKGTDKQSKLKVFDNTGRGTIETVVFPFFDRYSV